MGPAKRWSVLAFSLGLACAVRVPAAEFELSPAETQRVAERQVVVRVNLDAKQQKGTVRAAIRIDAPPDLVFQTLIQCANALEFVPHLRQCQVRDRAADDSWLLVEHVIDFGWYSPSVHWVFRTDLERPHRITFHQVSGDFKANEGAWEFESADDGTSTLVRYQAFVDPPGFVPKWLARSTFRRELPEMLRGLRKHCETEQSQHAEAHAAPR